MLRKTSKISSKRYRIAIEHSFGPYSTPAEVSTIKSKLKMKVSKISFSALTKTSRGYKFKGRSVYVKSVAASPSAIKHYLATQNPGAKVTVTRA